MSCSAEQSRSQRCRRSLSNCRMQRRTTRCRFQATDTLSNRNAEAEAEAKLQDRECADSFVSGIFSYVLEDLALEDSDVNLFSEDVEQVAASLVRSHCSEMTDLDSGDQDDWSMEYDDADEIDDDMDAAIDAHMACSYAQTAVDEGIARAAGTLLANETDLADEIALLMSQPPEAPREMDFDLLDATRGVSAPSLECDEEPPPAPIEDEVCEEAAAVDDDDLELLHKMLEGPLKPSVETTAPEITDLLEEAEALLADGPTASAATPHAAMGKPEVKVHTPANVAENAPPMSSPAPRAKKSSSRTTIGGVIRAPALQKDECTDAFTEQRCMRASRSETWLAGSFSTGTRQQRRATPSQSRGKGAAAPSAMSLDLGLDGGHTPSLSSQCSSVWTSRTPALGELRGIPFSSKQASTHSMMSTSKSTGELVVGVKAHRRPSGDAFAWSVGALASHAFRMERNALAPIF